MSSPLGSGTPWVVMFDHDSQLARVVLMWGSDSRLARVLVMWDDDSQPAWVLVMWGDVLVDWTALIALG